MMYRSTLHTVNGVSPSKMLYERTIHTKLPELCQLENTCEESRDRDRETKEKDKMYKLSTNFNQNPMKIVSKGRNGELVDSPEGVHYRRNVTHLKFIGEMPNSSIKPRRWRSGLERSHRKQKS